MNDSWKAARSDGRGRPVPNPARPAEKSAADSLPPWFDRTERGLKAALAVMLLLLVLFQFMPFSPAIRDVFQNVGRLEGEPYKP